MSENASENSYLGILTKLGHPTKEREINGKRVLIVGEISEELDNVLEKISKYKRRGGDCFDATEAEIKQGKANGCFANTTSPRHVFPSLKADETFIAYDNPLAKNIDVVVFAGNETEVSRAAEDFFSINHPYGKGFVFQETVDG